LLSIIVNNKVDEFKDEFDLSFNIDELISMFYDMAVSKDDVLEKASYNGFNSLTENDYRILKHVE
jgi:hypothetical protein